MRYDDQDFEAFYRQNYAAAYWYFRRARIADDEAHDLAQEVFANILKAWGQYRGEAERGYVKVVAQRVLLTRIRAIGAECRRGEEQSIDAPGGDAELIALPPDIVETERRRILRELIDRLPRTKRECVNYWIDGYSYAEIALMARISEESVRTHLRDARKMMKEDYDAQQK